MLADTADPDAIGADFSSRPELAATLAGRRHQDQRRSETLDREILATAAPVFTSGRVVGGVRLTQSVDAVNDAVGRTVLGIAAVGLAVLLAALAVAFLLARGITRPIERLGAAADRIATGDLDARAAVEGSREQRSLAHSFLGLPIARELMRRWGGDAALANRPEGGARATLTAPAFAGSLPTDP